MRSALPMHAARGQRVLVACLLVSLVPWATAQTPDPNPKVDPHPARALDMLSWLPSDTETVIVANRPPVLPRLWDFQKSPERLNVDVAFGLLAYTPLVFKSGALAEYF